MVLHSARKTANFDDTNVGLIALKYSRSFQKTYSAILGSNFIFAFESVLRRWSSSSARFHSYSIALAVSQIPFGDSCLEI